MKSQDNPISMTIDRLDHLALTPANVEAALPFYQNVLGMQIEEFGENRCGSENKRLIVTRKVLS